MTTKKRLAFRWKRSEDGANLVEYVLLVSLIAVVCLGGVAFLGQGVNDRFSRVGSDIIAAEAP